MGGITGTFRAAESGISAGSDECLEAGMLRRLATPAGLGLAG